MHVLFVCKYNRFRSKIAEAIFNERRTDMQLEARSAGIIQWSLISPQIAAAATRAGVGVRNPPQPVSLDLLKWQDIVVIVADDVPPELFENVRHVAKVVCWGIPDAPEDDPVRQDAVVERIRARVQELLRVLE